MNSIFTRRSVRNWTEQNIEQSQLDKILAAGMQAPSSMNQQPWQFVTVQNKQTLNLLSTFSPFAKSIAAAPCAIILLADVDSMRYKYFWQQDMAACTQNMLLEITELGLGGVWYGVAGVHKFEHSIKALLSLPDGIEPFAVIALGYAKEQEANYFKDNFKKEKIHTEKY